MDMTPKRVAGETLRRIQAEFLEMPGLRLTEPQARRLWDLDRVQCSAAVNMLVEVGFLLRTRDGAVMRVEPTAPARAELPRPSSYREKVGAA